MIGTILAAFLATLVGSASVYVLLARREIFPQKEAKPTPKRHEPEYVTREQLNAAIEEATKELNYEWNEWYEKFDKLHLRLAKRADREKKREAQQIEMPEDEGEGQPSVLAFRRLGSV